MTLKIISWNLNMYNISKIDFNNRCSKVISELISKCNDVDIIVLIESSLPFLEKLKNSDIKKDFSLYPKLTMSHGGIINILYNKKNIKESDIKQYPLDNMVPVLLINLTKGKENYFLGGCHLAPFAENSELRIQEILIARSLVPLDKPLVLIGDMNMREKESKFIEQDKELFQLSDSGDKRKTWFKSFFEENSPVSSKFDRVFISQKLKINNFELFGRKSVNGKMELLSDHLAIKVDIHLKE